VTPPSVVGGGGGEVVVGGGGRAEIRPHWQQKIKRTLLRGGGPRPEAKRTKKGSLGEVWGKKLLHDRSASRVGKTKRRETPDGKRGRGKSNPLEQKI